MLLMGLIVTGIYLLVFYKDYKKGIILTGMTVQFMTYIGTGIPKLKIATCLVLVSLLIVIWKKIITKTDGNKDDKYPKTILVASLLIASSFLISNYHAVVPETALICVNIMTALVFPYLFWLAISSKEYLLFALKCLLGTMTLAAIIAIPEQVFKQNLFTQIVTSLFLTEDFIIDSKEIRFGLKRANSIFSYFSVLGTISCFSTLIFFFVKYKYTDLYKGVNGKILTILCLFLPFCAFASGSRAIFIGLGAVIIACILTKQFIKDKTFPLLLLTSTLLLPVIILGLSLVLDSIINSDTSKQVSGSSSELRASQWAICLPYFLQSPIWGNGRMFIWDFVARKHPLLLGAESIWYSILVDYGLIGAFAFSALLILTAITLYKKKKSYVFLPISYFLITLVSPDSGIQYNIYLTFVILLLKCHKFSSQTANGDNRLVPTGILQ